MKVDMTFDTKDECQKAFERNDAIGRKINQQKYAAWEWKNAHKVRGRIAIATEVLTLPIPKGRGFLVH